MNAAPGTIRDAIKAFLERTPAEASLKEIQAAVESAVGKVSASSVRSYLNNNTPGPFARCGRGCYRLSARSSLRRTAVLPSFAHGRATLYQGDCFAWLEHCQPRSIHAVVTDPPYGLVEYTDKEQEKLRKKKGGVWRIPPSFDGHQRSPLPRFTILAESDRQELHRFFARLAVLLSRVCVPGANIIIASNPLLSHVVASTMASGGLELRGYIARLVMTMRGGDRPKNAHTEFHQVSVMPRSQWEPWVVLRTPLEGRVQDNLRKWGTGGFRRISEEKPFGDVINSAPATASERQSAPHPSLKPQVFMRQIVRGALPLGKGLILDPFAGSGATLAAANAVGYESIGIELDPHYAALARSAIPALSSFVSKIDPVRPQFDNARTIKSRRSGLELTPGIFE